MDPTDAHVVDPLYAALESHTASGVDHTVCVSTAVQIRSRDSIDDPFGTLAANAPFLVIPTMTRNPKSERRQAPCPSADQAKSIVAALARLRPSETDWLARVEDVVVTEGGERCRALFVDASDPSAPRVWPEAKAAGDAGEGVRRLISILPRSSVGGFLRRLFSGARCFTVSARLDEALYRDWSAGGRSRSGIGDALCVTACERPGVGVVLWFCLGARASMPRVIGRRWEEIAAALLKAVEARSRERSAGHAAEQAVTVATSSRRSRGESRDAVAVREKVFERMSKSTMPVLSDLEASVFRRELLRGEWSLLDHFDREGKRYFTWARADGASDRKRALTKRERDVLERVAKGQADRSIAMELRCSPSTVATHRLRAMSKLGLRSRALFSQVLASVTGNDTQS